MPIEILNLKEIILENFIAASSSTMLLLKLTALILISSICAKHYLVETEGT